jgi:endonuclease/exonuclease/phosphatase family metal-dependent hydrolase
MSWNITLNSIFRPDGVRRESFPRIIRALEPDVIALQEVLPDNGDELTALMNKFLPLPEERSWSVHVVSDNALISRFPMKHRGGRRVVPYAFPQFGNPDFHFGFAAAYIDLAGSGRPRDLYVIAMHNKSGASDESVRLRQIQSDSIIQWLRDLRTTQRAESILTVTPFLIMGDMNVLAGVSMQPYETLISGDIADEETFGPDYDIDWDGTVLADAIPSLNGKGELHYTWRIDELPFPPGALDRILFSDSLMSIDQQFILDTTSMSDSDLGTLGLERADVLYGGASGYYDHLPLIVDFALHE